MKTELFDFELPEPLIAARPVFPRDASRMLVVSEGVQDAMIADLPAFLRPGDVMVFNDTKVIPARLMGRRGDVQVELLLHKKLDSQQVGGGNDKQTWRCFARPAKRLKPGNVIHMGDDFTAEIIEKLEFGEIVAGFSGQDFFEKLQRYGQMPLPPYIEKQRKRREPLSPSNDSTNYQTVYARHEGSVAAPTAGLHFTEALLSAIDAHGVERAHVTLHVGAGTFLPVKAEDTRDHIMHSEYAVVDQEAAEKINHAKAQGGRIIAVGTTSLRTLESAADGQGLLRPFAQETSIFITPGYRFKQVDALLTNFHLPRSTLFMLVSAFSGLEQMHAAYRHAIKKAYRFYSYGDACLLFPHP